MKSSDNGIAIITEINNMIVFYFDLYKDANNKQLIELCIIIT